MFMDVAVDDTLLLGQTRQGPMSFLQRPVEGTASTTTAALAPAGRKGTLEEAFDAISHWVNVARGHLAGANQLRESHSSPTHGSISAHSSLAKQLEAAQNPGTTVLSAQVRPFDATTKKMSVEAQQRHMHERTAELLTALPPLV